MAVSNEDLARLVVTLDADVTKMYNGLKRAQQQTNTAASGIEKRLTQMSSNIDRTFANLGQRMSSNLTAPLAGIGAAFSVAEVVKYADAWTVAANKVAAAGDIVGIQARPLRELRELADEGRSSFEDTIQLYSRMLRAAGGVAQSELEIAKATDIVNKAFKAGGAATSEMQAGILQLSQGLSSGVLQGDELRSVRENAPVLAQVMADYFKTTIGGLKELGSQGKLTSDLVFKAILSGEAQIESAFGKTNRTIGESFQLVQNRLIEYIGTADQTAGATSTITQALTFLADNFNQTADVVLKLAAVIAGALIGRSILGMVAGVGQAVMVLRTLNAVMKEAATSGAKFGAVMSAAFGPLAIIIGGVAAVAFQELSSNSIEAAANIAAMNSRVENLGGATIETAKSIREAASALDVQTEATKKLAEAERQRNLAQALTNEDQLRNGNFFDNAKATLPVGYTQNSELNSALTIANRAKSALDSVFQPSKDDKAIYVEIERLSQGLRDATIPADAVIARIRQIQNEPMSAPALELLDSLDSVAISLKNVEFVKKVELDTTDIDNYREKLIDALQIQYDLASMRGDVAFADDIAALITKLEEGQISASDTKVELDRLAGTNATFAGFLSGLTNLVNGLMLATEKALALEEIANRVSGRSAQLPGPTNGRGELGRRRRGREEEKETAREYIEAQKEYNSLTEKERTLREEIARIVKESGVKKGNFAPGELETLASDNLARKEADKEARKKGGGSKSDSEKFFEDLSKEERANEILQEELLLRQTLNPLINDYGLALEKAKKEQELLVAAEEAGVALTPEVRERIAAIAELYATTTAEIEKTTAAQERLKQTVQEWTDITKSATRSFIDDLIEGKSAAEAFGNVLNQIGSKLIDFGLDTLFNGNLSGGGGFGGLGSLIGGIFGLPGRASGGPVNKGQAYIVGEKRPEVFVPNQSGVIIPRVPNNMGGSSVNAPVSIQIDATGADSAGLARLQTELVKIKAEMPYMIKQQVSQRSKKGW